MHTHFYKLGGEWTTPAGDEYTIKAFNRLEGREALNNGWSRSLEDAMAIDHEQAAKDDLKSKIKQLGGTFGGRSSVAKLETQLKELQNGHNNQG